MKRNVLHRFGYSFAIVSAAAVMAACADTPSAPSQRAAVAARKSVDLGSCSRLAAPEGSVLLLHAFATGSQIYRWNGTSWSFVAPSATLYADSGLTGQVATHFAGPTWQSNSGSQVVGSLIDKCTPDASAIPWLLLSAASNTTPGIFQSATHIQRLFTVGGLAPAEAGSFVGEVRNVPYTAQYYFYRAQ